MGLAVNLEFQSQVLVHGVLPFSAVSKVAAEKSLHPRHHSTIQLASAANGFARKNHLGATVITDDCVPFARDHKNSGEASRSEVAALPSGVKKEFPYAAAI